MRLAIDAPMMVGRRPNASAQNAPMAQPIGEPITITSV